MPKTSFSLGYFKKMLKFKFSDSEILENLERLALEAEIKDNHLDIEVTAERPDLLSAEGVARAINSFNNYNRFYSKKSCGLTTGNDTNYPFYAKIIAQNVDLGAGGLEELIGFRDKFVQTYGRGGKKINLDFEDFDGGENDKIISNKKKINAGSRNLVVKVSATNEKATEETCDILACHFIDSGADISSVRSLPEDKVFPQLDYKPFNLNPQNIARIIGVELNEKEIFELLKKAGYWIDSGKLFISPYRTDILGEADIAGDIVIVKGIENILTPTKMKRAEYGKDLRLKTLCQYISDLSLRMSFTEVKNFILINPDENDMFNRNYIKTSNAKSRLYSACRNSLQPGLLKIISVQAQNLDRPINLFEIGEAVEFEEVSYETIKWAAAIMDSSASFSRAKSVIQTVLSNTPSNILYTLRSSKNDFYISGRAAEVIIEGRAVGVLGEVSPRVLDFFSIKEPVCTAEIDCRYLIKSYQ